MEWIGKENIMSKVKKIGDPILRKKTELITDFAGTYLYDLVTEMTTIMREERGIGLAANQAGISKAICIIDITQGKNPVEVFINPEILSQSDLIDFEEGCLSIPGVSATTKRFSKIKVKYQDIDGNLKEEDMDGLRAIAIQHEVDHLNGKLYVDKLSRLKRDITLKKYRKNFERKL